MCTCVQSHGRAPVRDDTVNDDQAYHVFIKQFQYQDAPLDPSRGARPGQAWNWDVLLIKMPKLVEAEVEVEMMVTDQDRTLTVTHLSNLWTLWRLLFNGCWQSFLYFYGRDSHHLTTSEGKRIFVTFVLFTGMFSSTRTWEQCGLIGILYWYSTNRLTMVQRQHPVFIQNARST